jgi:hypothetical protein
VPQGSSSFVTGSRLLILGWLIAWIFTVPLFHTHLPDNTDRWSLLQSGGPHTVLSPDLPGEYAPPSHDSRRDASNQIATRVVNSPEIGFIAFGEQVKQCEAFTIVESLSPFRSPPLFHRLAVTFATSRAPPPLVAA